MSKVALICGVGGQDGAYLAQLLLSKGYSVWGTSRDAQASTFQNLKKLNIKDRVNLISVAPTDFRSVLNSLQLSAPDEIYFLSAQSSVGLSFEQPVETLESVAIGALNFLEAIRFFNPKIKFYNAGSSECFGDLGLEVATEESPFRPCSPYGIAKASAHWLVASYRDSYGIYACNGILFNHESPLRPKRFVTSKIISAACRIAMGSNEKLLLGRLDIERDWGWAPEYVEAMWLMLQQDMPDDFIIATGRTSSLEQFVQESFSALGLSWKPYVITDKTLCRPNDLTFSKGSPYKAEFLLGWKAKFMLNEIIQTMVAAELEDLKQSFTTNMVV